MGKINFWPFGKETIKKRGDGAVKIEEPEEDDSDVKIFNPEDFKRWGKRINELEKDEVLRVKYGVSTISKSEVLGKNDGRKNQDAYFADQDRGLFAVFDGVGSDEKSADSACQASIEMGHLADDLEPKTMLEIVNSALTNKKCGGATTGTIAKFVDNNGNKEMRYASVGDSRIYLIRDGKANLITNDDNVSIDILKYINATDEEKISYLFHGISASLNEKNFLVSQGNFGKINLKSKDRVVICSDGVSGDVDEETLELAKKYFNKDINYRIDRMSNDEMAGIVDQNIDDSVAAQELIYRSKKIDDKTAIVVTV